jgi:site-specific DNA-methyltransferase (adenine-specific)
MTEKLHIGDNLEYMRTLQSNSIDLIYSDILYGTGRNFGDYQDIKANRKDVEAFYIPRIIEFHRLLKTTGSIYLQMDTRINHWMRCIMDDVFSYDNFLNEIVWTYKGRINTKFKFDNKYDIIMSYTKTNKYTYHSILKPYSDKAKKEYRHEDENGKYAKVTKRNKDGMKLYKAYIKEGVPVSDVWADIPAIFRSSKEKTGYQTQKPKVLIERIIKASSNEGDLVADFYAGSFTTAEVCKDLKRNFIGCDINPNCLKKAKERGLFSFTDEQNNAD